MALRFRKTAPKVRGGKVQRKNRTDHACLYCHEPEYGPVIQRARPDPGFRHVLHQSSVYYFLRLPSDWEELWQALNTLLLAPGRPRHRRLSFLCALRSDQPK
jgi:hypothetical protein